MILVTAATGKVGRELVGLLLRNGEKVAAVARNPVAATLPPDCSNRAWRPMRPRDPGAALRGVAATFLNLAAPGNATADLLWLAHRHGMECAILLSDSESHSSSPPVELYG